MANVLQAIRADLEPLRSLAYTSMTSSYVAIGTPFDHPAHIIWVQNTTNVQLIFSNDGINDKFTLPANGYVVLDVTGNQAAYSGFFLPTDTLLWVKAVGTPTSGSAYVTVIYGDTI